MLMLTLTGFLHLPNVSAEPRYYDIEVIIFDDANEKYLRSEYWPQKPETQSVPPPANETAYPIITSLEKAETDNNATTDNSSIFQNIEPSILVREAKRINASRHYNLLFYGAWTQEGLNSKHAININLEQLSNHADVKTKNTITGELKIVLARYLHFYAELEYIPEHKRRFAENVVMNKEVDNNEISDESNQSLTEEQVMVDYYPISNHRRMRSKVLHYIDHPLVGILVQINPVKKADVVSH